MSGQWYKSAEAMRADGFTGFKSIRELRECALQGVPSEFGDIGVYVVLLPGAVQPTFLAMSPGGRFKGRDPSVDADTLNASWIPDTSILYIGKAGKIGGSVTLRKRLKQYLDFGSGRPVGHWGGRYIWQLASSNDLVVCWKRTPDQDPRDVERRMISHFVSVFGRRPFANLRG